MWFRKSIWWSKVWVQTLAHLYRDNLGGSEIGSGVRDSVDGMFGYSTVHFFLEIPFATGATMQTQQSLWLVGSLHTIRTEKDLFLDFFLFSQNTNKLQRWAQLLSWYPIWHPIYRCYTYIYFLKNMIEIRLIMSIWPLIHYFNYTRFISEKIYSKLLFLGIITGNPVIQMVSSESEHVYLSRKTDKKINFYSPIY